MYKRQDPDLGGGDIKNVQAAAQQKHDHDEVCRRASAQQKPVSYTHLDVYKRQEYYTVNNSRWTGKENRNARAVFKKEEDECGTYCILPEFTKPLGRCV